MTDSDKRMIKNVCTGCASSIYNSIAGSNEVILNVTVRAVEDGSQVSHIETIVINNGE